MKSKRTRKAQYDIEYHKLNKRQFNTDLSIEEFEEIESFRKARKITRREIIIKGYMTYKEEFENKN